MEKSLNKIITAILSGDDYRPFVLETINRRFINNVNAILIKVFEARKRNTNNDWWYKELISLSQSKEEMLWFGGLNKKTVRSMTGGDRKEVCIELGRQNFQTIQNLISELSNDEIPRLEIIISYKGKNIRLTEGESVLLMNTVASMKLTVQGGAWSEVGKKVEKRLLFTIFKMLCINPNQYLLVFKDMIKLGFVGNREIDAIVFTDDNQRKLEIELKLLAANSEIGDEAFSRGVDLFLVDKLSPMMIEEGKKIGVTTIELRDKNAINNIYKFFHENKVSVKPPNLTDIAGDVVKINKLYDESLENKAILKKAKELVK